MERVVSEGEVICWKYTSSIINGWNNIALLSNGSEILLPPEPELPIHMLTYKKSLAHHPVEGSDTVGDLKTVSQLIFQNIKFNIL